MELAASFSCEKGYLNKKECSRIINLLKQYKLNFRYNISAEKIEELIIHDKKKSGADIYFVFIKGIGKPVVTKVPVKEVVDFFRQVKKR